MTSEVIKGQIRSSQNYKIIFFSDICCLTPNLFKNVNIMKMQILQYMKYDLKGHTYKTTFMPKSFQQILLRTDFDEKFYECYYNKDTIYDLKCHFYAMENFRLLT